MEKGDQYSVLVNREDGTSAVNNIDAKYPTTLKLGLLQLAGDAYSNIIARSGRHYTGRSLLLLLVLLLLLLFLFLFFFFFSARFKSYTCSNARERYLRATLSLSKGWTALSCGTQSWSL